MRRTAILALMLTWVLPAQAEWMQASSAHFVVYADDNETNIRGFAEKLERFQAALAFVSANKLPTPSPSNRVTVYVVTDERQVRRLAGGSSSNLAGFYIPRPGGSIAIVPRVRNTGRELDWSMKVLLHEYTHHFQFAASPVPLPRWVSEGVAEFFASASFERNGDVSVGRPALHRAGELFFGRDVKAADLIDTTNYDRRRAKSNDAFYGKSWLLYHYLTFENSRRGQLQKYIQNIYSGKGLREAGEDAFGDLNALESAIDTYLRKPRLMMLAIPATELAVGAIQIRSLSEGEAAAVPIVIRSKIGVNQKQAAELLVEARAVATRYPQDPAVMAALAECEFDAGNDTEAIAAADAAIAADPSRVNAYIQKGYALFRIASKANDAAAYARARAPFLALNKQENDHPLPLIYYYYSYTQQQREPTPVAIQGLSRAVDLAPFDLGLRMTLAERLLITGDRASARNTMVPVAFNAHGGTLAQFAQRVIARLDAEPNWDAKEGLTAMRTEFEESLKKAE